MSKKPVNAGDEEQVKARTAAAERRARIAAEDTVAVMNTPAGRRFVWGLLADTHMFHSSYRFGGPVEDAVFREGERNIGLQLFARLQTVCPDLYARMVGENIEVT